MKSWKIGAVAGLIAGIVAGIVAFISIIIGTIMGLYAASPLPIESLALNYIVLNVVWGLILGVIYSMIYNIIPGNYVSKGLLFGLMIWLIAGPRCSFFLVAYTLSSWAKTLTFVGFFTFVSYGLVLGVLYNMIGKK